GSARSFPNSNGAITLDVAVTTHRAQPRTRFSNLTTQQHQVYDLLNVRDCVAVLRQPHGPTEDRALGFSEDLRGLFNFILRDSGLRDDVSPRHCAERGSKFLKPIRVVSNEIVIENSSWSLLFECEHRLHHPFQQRHIAVDAHL